MDDGISPNYDRLVANNANYTEHFTAGDRPVAPSSQLAVVACMDSRMNVSAILGLDNGEAHVIRNAGGVITDDVIRSVCLSQRALGTREIVLLHHTDCGLSKVTEDSFRNDLRHDVGVTPPWALESFTDPYVDVRQSIQRLRLSPFIEFKDHISGFVYNVATGALDNAAEEAGRA